MPVPLKHLRQLDEMRYHTPVTVAQFEPLPVPSSVAVSGNTGGFVVTWAQVAGADGYRVAVMTDRDRSHPDRGTFEVVGGATTRFLYIVANVTRGFAVAAMRAGIEGPYSTVVTATAAAGSFVSDNPASPSTNDVTTPSASNEGHADYGWQDPNVEDVWD